MDFDRDIVLGITLEIIVLECDVVTIFDRVMVEKLGPEETDKGKKPVVVIIGDEDKANNLKRPFESDPFEVIAVIPKDYWDLEQKLLIEIDEETRKRIAIVFCHRYWHSEDYPWIIQTFINNVRGVNDEALVFETGNAINITKYYTGVNASIEIEDLENLATSCPQEGAKVLEYFQKKILFDRDWSFAMDIAEEADEWGRNPESFLEYSLENRTIIFSDYLNKFFFGPRHKKVLERIGIDEADFREAFWELPELRRIDLIHLVFKELNLLYANGNMHDLDIQRIQGILHPPSE